MHEQLKTLDACIEMGGQAEAYIVSKNATSEMNWRHFVKSIHEFV